jgi:hypothetical protein
MGVDESDRFESDEDESPFKSSGAQPQSATSQRSPAQPSSLRENWVSYAQPQGTASQRSPAQLSSWRENTVPYSKETYDSYLGTISIILSPQCIQLTRL